MNVNNSIFCKLLEIISLVVVLMTFWTTYHKLLTNGVNCMCLLQYWILQFFCTNNYWPSSVYTFHSSYALFARQFYFKSTVGNCLLQNNVNIDEHFLDTPLRRFNYLTRRKPEWFSSFLPFCLLIKDGFFLLVT